MNWSICWFLRDYIEYGIFYIRDLFCVFSINKEYIFDLFNINIIIEEFFVR